MLLSWVEEESGSRFDNAGKLMALQKMFELLDLCGRVGIVWAEPAMINRDRNASKSGFGEQCQTVLSIVIGKPVCVVADYH